MNQRLSLSLTWRDSFASRTASIFIPPYECSINARGYRMIHPGVPSRILAEVAFENTLLARGTIISNCRLRTESLEIEAHLVDRSKVETLIIHHKRRTSTQDVCTSLRLLRLIKRLAISSDPVSEVICHRSTNVRRSTWKFEADLEMSSMWTSPPRNESFPSRHLSSKCPRTTTTSLFQFSPFPSGAKLDLDF